MAYFIFVSSVWNKCCKWCTSYFFEQILLTMIWLWQYAVMHEIATIFGIHVSSVHKIIHHTTRYLHAYLVPKYIKWHTMPQWRSLRGFYPEWPRVVAILDCTPFRISKPTGEHNKNILAPNTHLPFYSFHLVIQKFIVAVSISALYLNIGQYVSNFPFAYFYLGPVQYIYYRKDRKCFFLNWLVIVDILGFIVLSRPGFLGRVADVTVLG